MEGDEPINIQNIPRDLKVVKECFVPKLDYFVFADYSSIEMRLLAFYLATSINKWNLVEEFKAGKDPHTETANLLNIDRFKAKTLNFSILYQGGINTVSKQLNISHKESAQLLRQFNAARPEIQDLIYFVEEVLLARGRGCPLEEAKDIRINSMYIEWKNYLQDAINAGAWVETIAHRKIRPVEARKALNAIIQGSAAELLKDAMRKTYPCMQNLKHGSHLILAIHDELIWDVDARELDYVINNIPFWMCTYNKITEVIETPVVISKSQSSWADKQEI